MILFFLKNFAQQKEIYFLYLNNNHKKGQRKWHHNVEASVL